MDIKKALQDIKRILWNPKDGRWRGDFENIPRGKPILLYSGEIGEPAVGCISETDDEVISPCPDYDRMELKHLDNFMIIPE